MTKRIFLIFFGVFQFTFLASAQEVSKEDLDRIEFGQARIEGQGCSQETVQFVPSPDGGSFSILFTDYTLESKRSFEAKSCRILVPVRLPRGQQIAIESTDLRGFMALPAKSYGILGAHSRFINSTGKAKLGRWASTWVRGEFLDEVFHREYFKKPVESFCSGQQWLEIYTYVGQMSLQRKKSATRMVTMDSVDSAGSIRGALRSVECQN